MRPLTCMKHSLSAMLNQTTPNVLQNLSREQWISFIQDLIHLATKLRNRLLKTSILLPMGSKQVSITHLKLLIRTIGKEIHGLVQSDICPQDRQNYISFEKITHDRVLKALEENIPDSEATVMYLKLSKNMIQAFNDVDMEPLKRVYLIWHALIYFRAWRKWIQKNKYHTENNFISSNAFTCIELNAYGILHLICKFRDSNRSDLFLPALFNSQPCEHTFRQFRSMTTANWTKINFSMLEVLQMISRIEMQNNIAYFKLPDLVILPRIHNKPEKHKIHTLPTNIELEEVLEKAQKMALLDAEKFGMILTDDEIQFCELTKGNIIGEQAEAIVNDDIDDFEYPDDFLETLDCTYFRDFSSTVDEIDGNSGFIKVLHKDGSERIISKGSLVWRATQSTKPLSKDRLTRVQAQKTTHPCESPKSTKKMYNSQHGSNAKKLDLRDELRIMNEIQIGEYCIFRKHTEDPHKNAFLKKAVIGMVLGFKYATGKTDKEKQYSLETAPTTLMTVESVTKRGIEVLALWYTLNDNLIFETPQIPSFFINIDNYVATVSPPQILQTSATNGKKYKMHGNVNKIRESLSELLQ